MSPPLSPRLQQLVAQVQANPRLRWGAIAIVAILLLYLVLVLMDWRAALHQEYQQRTTDLYKMAALAGQDQWLVRAQEARSLRRALEAEIPSATSIGIAQAEVQTTTRQVLTAFGPTLNSASQSPVQVAGRPGLWRIPVTINGVVQPRLLLEILRRIEGSSKLTVIEQFSLVLQQGRPVLSMVVVAYYRIPSATEAGDEAP